MGSRPPVGSAVEQILKNVDLASIQDERARECIRLLLNLIESLTAELRKAQAENQYLREQLQRRRGGGGKAGGKPGSPRPLRTGLTVFGKRASGSFGKETPHQVP